MEKHVDNNELLQPGKCITLSLKSHHKTPRVYKRQVQSSNTCYECYIQQVDIFVCVFMKQDQRYHPECEKP